MRILSIVIVVLFLLTVPVSAMEFTAPTAPEDAEKYMPKETEDFGEGIRFVIRTALEVVQPSFWEAFKVCTSLIVVSLLVGLLADLSESGKRMIELAGAIITGVLLFQPVDSMIHMGAETVLQISQYGKLLLPVMTGALAAQGGLAKSGALYMATALFDALLSSVMADLLVPLVYIFLCICTAERMFPQPLLKEMGKFLKWLMTWGLKTILYVFTGYISITGVVGGTTDATVLKATKLTISGMVPVVGSILSDASEAVLVSAGFMKNAAGIYGLLVMAALWIGPFLQIGVQYILIKVTVGICEMFGVKKMVGIMKDFSNAMGLTLAMISTICLIFVISTICFMKGVA